MSVIAGCPRQESNPPLVADVNPRRSRGTSALKRANYARSHPQEVTPTGAKAAAERARAARQTLGKYAEAWLAARARDLTPRTVMRYRSILDRDLQSELAAMALDELEPGTVRAWYVRPALGQADPPRPRLLAAADDDGHRRD